MQGLSVNATDSGDGLCSAGAGWALEVTKAKCPHFMLKEMEAQAASCLGLAATCVTLDM